MRQVFPVLALVSLVACSSSGGDDPPTTPTPQANRAPVVTAVLANPTFGVQDFGIYTFNASATDADGDPLTFTWNIAGNARTGAAVQAGPFSNGGTGQATVTVTDGRGGSTSGSVNFVVGTMTGTWVGSVQGPDIPTFAMSLTQVAGLFAGAIAIPQGTGEVGPTGAIATINASGAIVMRVKVAPFNDFTMTGQMSGTGTTVTGSVTGSGFTGQAFIMNKQ